MTGFESIWSDEDDVLPKEWISSLDSDYEESLSSLTYSENSNGMSSPVGLSAIPSLRVSPSPATGTSAPSTSDESNQSHLGESSFQHSFILPGRSGVSDMSSHTPEIGHTLRSIQDNPDLPSISVSSLPFDDLQDNSGASSFPTVPKEGSSGQTTKQAPIGLRVVNPNIPHSIPQGKRKSPSQEGNASKKYVFSLP